MADDNWTSKYRTAPAPSPTDTMTASWATKYRPTASAPPAPVAAPNERPGVGTIFGRGIDQIQGMGYGAVEAVGEAVGSEGLTEFGREGREFNNRQMAEGPQNQDFWEIDSVGDAFAFAKESVVQNTPQIGVSAAGALAGAAVGSVGGPAGVAIGGFLGALVPSFGMALGEVQGIVKEKDPNAAPSGWTWAGATAVAALDSVLPGRIGSTLRRTLGKELAEEGAKAFLTANIKKEVLKGIGEEGLTEAMQSVVAEAAAAKATNQEMDRDWWRNAIAEGVAGALVGGTFSGATAAVSKLRSPPAADPGPAPEETPTELPPIIPDEEYDSPRLSDEDRASPIPNQILDEGYAMMDGTAPQPVRSSVPAEERAALLNMGDTNEDIDLMTPEERAANLEKARISGVKVTEVDVQRARTYAQAAPASTIQQNAVEQRGERPALGDTLPQTETRSTAIPEGNGDWTVFDRKMRSLNIPRAEMPQVKSGDRSALVQYLKARDVDYTTATVDPYSLQPTQAEFSPSKVAQAKEYKGTDRAILVSSDFRIVDGHHQWLAAREKGDPVSVIKLNAPVSELLPMVREFPSSTTAPAEGSGQPTPTLAGASPQVQGEPTPQFGGTSPQVTPTAVEGKVKAYPIAKRSEWYGEADFDKQGGKIERMTPDQFLARARPLEIDEVSRENIDDLKRHMLEGKTLDPLKFFDGGKEDGRHRAVAAKELGIKTVPVVTFGDQVDKKAASKPKEASVEAAKKQKPEIDKEPDNEAVEKQRSREGGEPSFSLRQRADVEQVRDTDYQGLRSEGRSQGSEGAEARQAQERATDGFSEQPVTGTNLARLNDVNFLKQFLKRPGWGVVTASVSPSDFITSKEDGPLKRSLMERHDRGNTDRNKRLRAILKRRGIPYATMEGVYKGQPDGTSYLIIADEATTLALGREFDQESILTRDGLIFARREQPDVRTTGDVMVGDRAASEDFYSVPQGGAPFSMGLALDQSGPGVPVIPTGYTTDPTRPQLPINADGMVELHHWSSRPLTEVDPTFSGTGPLRGPEARRGARLSFFGINPRRSMRAPGTGYVKEAGLGSIEHIALVDPSRLYPYMEDPDGLVRGRDISAAESAIRDAGYIGYYTTDNGSGDAPLGNVAALFEPVPVQRKVTSDEASFQRQAGDGRGRDPRGSRAPLAGAPQVKGASGPDQRLNAVAEDYARSIGIDLRRQAEYVSVDPDRAARIAQAYEDMEHAPNDPVVREAFQNLIQQTRAQYDALVEAGYEFFFIDEQNDIYGGNPWNAMRDLRANQRMGVFPTEAGFGSGATDAVLSGNPMEADTGLTWGVGSVDGQQKRVLANDLFRAVHDAFGHGLEGSGFRADGEENAWQSHVRLFTGSAVGAITTETRGQNSWLNYGPYGEQNRTAKVEDTVFADQKTGLMPSWTWTEGRAGDMDTPSERRTARITETDGEVTTNLELTEGFLAEAVAVGTFFRRELDRLGMSDISLRVSERMTAMVQGENWTVDGRYFRKLIDVALTSRDRANTFNHEVIHALKALGVFSDNEWAILERKATKEWMAKHDILERYANLSPTKQREEAIAQAHADWVTGAKVDGIIAKSFRKIRDVIEALGNGLRGRGFRSVNGIFKDIQSGRIGNRERGFNKTSRTVAQRLREAFQIAGTERRPVFYSPLVRAIQGAKQTKATSEDWKAILSKLPGVKAIELEWIGVNDWLDAQDGQVTREDLQAYVNENQLEVTTEQLAGEGGQYDTSDIRSYVEEPIYPDDWADYADIYMDDAREELEADLEDGETVDDEAVQARAEELAQEAYEPYEYTARIRTSDGEHLLTGYYNSDDRTYFFRELSDDEILVDDLDEMMVEYVNGLNPVETTDGMIPVVGKGKFGGYTETGGDNYREILLRMPNLDQQGKNKVRSTDTGPFAQEPLGEARPFINDSHFSQENIVVHARVKDRVDADGKKVMFIEEIQSDLGSTWRKVEQSERSEPRRKELWEQINTLDGRGMAIIEEIKSMIGQNVEDDKGYRVAMSPSGNVLVEEVVNSWFNNSTPSGRVKAELTEDLVINEEAKALALEFGRISDELSTLQDELYAMPAKVRADPTLPQTPFLNENYYALMVKRLLREAVDNGYAKVMWTPGYMQARRWDKAAQEVVEDVRWGSSDGVKRIVLEMSEGRVNTVTVDTDGTMQKWNGEDSPQITGKPLSALLGDAAKDILSKPKGEITGEKITFSNSGYAVAYDTQIRKAVEKLTKRYGAKVEVNKSLPDFVIEAVDDPEIERAFEEFVDTKSEPELMETIFRVFKEKGYSEDLARRNVEGMVEQIMTRDGVSRIAALRQAVVVSRRSLMPSFTDFTPPSPKGEAVWSVDITPEMVKDIQQGLPMFQKAKQTATEAFKKWFGDSKVVDENGEPLVVYHGTDAADFDTFKPGSYFTADPPEASAYTFASNLGRRERSTGKYRVGSGAEFVGQRLPYYGTISDIDAPQAGAVYATDQGVLRSLPRGRWEVFSDIEVDYDGNLDGDTMPVKAGNFDAQSVVDEYEAYVQEVSPGGEGGRMYPVYLSIKNPVVLSPLEGNRLGRRLGATDGSIEAEIAKYRALGYDGIETTSDEGALFTGETIRQFIPFSPNQIKSATGNNGNFDPNDDRMSFSLGQRVKDVQDAAGKVINQGIIDAKSRNKVDRATAEDGEGLSAYIHRKIIDRLDPLSRLVQSLGGKLADMADPYLQARLYDDRTRVKIQVMYDKYLQPALDELVKYGVELKELHEYLYALHAEERNKVVGLRNPPGHQFYKAVTDPRIVGASGWSTNQAKAVLSRVNADPRKAGPLIRAAKNIRQMLDENLAEQMAAGLIDRETYDMLTQQWKNYVPMKNDDGMDPSGNFMASAGKGFDIRGKEFEAAVGSFSEADNVILHAAKQAVRAHERMGKNEVGKAMLRLLNKHDPQGTKIAEVYWSDEPAALGNIVKAQVVKRRKLDASGKVVWTSQPNPFMTAEDVIATKVGGRIYYIKFHDQKVGNALKNLHAEPLGFAMSILSRVSNWQSLVNTRMNPAFTPINIIRDLWTGYASLGAFGFTDKERRQVVGNVGSAMMAMGRNVFGKVGTTAEQRKWDAIVADFITDGGRISFDNYASLTKDVEALEASIARASRISSGGMTPIQRGKEMFSRFITLIERLNDAGENGLRIAVYDAAIRKGMTRQRAAFLARDITVDFKKKGELGTEMNAAYVFFNSSLQGNYNLAVRMGTSKAVRNVAAKFLLAGIAISVINSMMAGDDEDGEDYYTKMLNNEPWKLERNLVLFIGGDKHLMVPLPFGFNAFNNVGVQLHAMGTGKRSVVEGISSIARVAFESFNPMGSGSIASMLTPTIADPFLDMAVNENFAGNPIRPTENQFDPAPPPAAEQSFKSTNPAFVWLAKAMNEVTGGNNIESGWGDVYPDNLEHLWAFMSGGVGRFISQIGETAVRATEGEFEPTKTPYVRSFFGEISPDRMRGQYFNIRADVQEAKAQLKDYIAQGDQQRVQEYRQERAVDLKVVGAIDAAEKARRQLNKQRKAIEKQAGPDMKERLEKLDEREAQIMLQARKAYIKALQGE